jgi:hypothetical protein
MGRSLIVVPHTNWTSPPQTYRAQRIVLVHDCNGCGSILFTPPRPHHGSTLLPTASRPYPNNPHLTLQECGNSLLFSSTFAGRDKTCSRNPMIQTYPDTEFPKCTGIICPEKYSPEISGKEGSACVRSTSFQNDERVADGRGGWWMGWGCKSGVAWSSNDEGTGHTRTDRKHQHVYGRKSQEPTRTFCHVRNTVEGHPLRYPLLLLPPLSFCPHCITHRADTVTDLLVDGSSPDLLFKVQWCTCSHTTRSRLHSGDRDLGGRGRARARVCVRACVCVQCVRACIHVAITLIPLRDDGVVISVVSPHYQSDHALCHTSRCQLHRLHPSANLSRVHWPALRPATG